MIAQHAPFVRTLASSWLLRLALIAAVAAALAAVLAASYLVPLGAHTTSSGGAFSAQPALAVYGGPNWQCGGIIAPC